MNGGTEREKNMEKCPAGCGGADCCRPVSLWQ